MLSIRLRRFAAVAFCCGGAVLLGCTKKAPVPICGTIIDMQGSVMCETAGETFAVQIGQSVKNGDILITSQKSNARMRLETGHTMVVSENTSLQVAVRMGLNDSSLAIMVHQTTGELFVGYPAKRQAYRPETLSVVCDSLSIDAGQASFFIQYIPPRGTIIKTFSENNDLSFAGRQQLSVASCHKILVESNGQMSKQLSLTEADYDLLMNLLTREESARYRLAFPCAAPKENESAENQPPVWETVPQKNGRIGVVINDTLVGSDPEGGPIRYSLVEGPSGMSIDSGRGILHFKPLKSGMIPVKIAAIDREGLSSTLVYALAISGAVTVVIKAAEMTLVGQRFTVDASASKNSRGTTQGLQLRFSPLGDGTWLSASDRKGLFEYTYEKPGTYTMAVEARESDASIGYSSKVVVVAPALKPVIRIDPDMGVRKTVYTLRVIDSAALDNTATSILSVRWDVDGNGVWDIPADGDYGEVSTIQHTWETAGVKIVKVEIKNGYGTTAAASAEITVYEGVVVQSIQAPDTVGMRDTFTVVCTASDSHFPIVEYAWDPAGTGMSQEVTNSNKYSCSYSKSGIYELVCSVKNSKGMSGSGSKKIVVINEASTVSAGGPYKTFVNTPLSVEGYAHDKDNAVVSYEWDFDGDGKQDWQSAQTSKTTHTFSKEGRAIIVLKVKFDDQTRKEVTAEVVVVNRPPIVYPAADIVSSPGKKVLLKGRATDPDRNIVSYAWDFEGDGTFDWNASDTGYVQHSFETYARAIFKVTDGSDCVALDTVRIVICPEGMETVKEGKFCIDTYEWPNKKGEKPLRNLTYEDAQQQCQKVGKRLCALSEMESACAGSKKKNIYPYGSSWQSDNCNCFGNRHISNSVAPSGEFDRCVSQRGVFDMSGNVAEWIASDGNTGYAFGGWWQDGQKYVTCQSFVPLSKGKKYTHVGFRCCK